MHEKYSTSHYFDSTLKTKNSLLKRKYHLIDKHVSPKICKKISFLPSPFFRKMSTFQYDMHFSIVWLLKRDLHT